MSDLQNDNAQAQAPATETQTPGSAAGTPDASAAVSDPGAGADVAVPAAVTPPAEVPPAITGTMAVTVTDQQLIDMAFGTAPAAPAVTTPAPAPVISDAQMRAACEQLTNGARMYYGMLDAAAALNQVGSLGAAVSERQTALNGLDSAIADRRARINALDQAIADQVAANERSMNAALRAASDKGVEANNQANLILSTAQGNATTLLTAARVKAQELLDAANTTASQIQMQTAEDTQTVAALEQKATELTGHIADLETNIALARASLRQLLGDS
jgi:hypothetical protein